MKIITGLFIIGLALSASGQVLVYSEKINGAGSFVQLDPLISPTGDLLGLVYIGGYGNSSLVVDRWQGQDTAVDLGFRLAGTANYVNNSGVFHIYGRSTVEDNEYDNAVHVAIAPDSTVVSIVSIPPYGNCQSAFDLCSPRGIEVRVQHDANGDPVEISMSNQRMTGIELLCNRDVWELPMSYTWNLALSSGINRREFTDVVRGNFANGERYIAYTNYLSEGGHCRDEPVPFYDTEALISLTDLSGQVIWNRADTFMRYSNLFADDFVVNVQGDEILLFGSPRDSMNSPLSHFVRCYSFASDSAEELWNLNVLGMDPTIVWKERVQVVGMSDSRHLRVYDYASGRGPGTVELERRLTARTLFLANASDGASEKALYLAGCHADTVFVYRFDALTAIEEHSDVTLPATFTVSNPYPNPFNPSTSIDLALPVNGHVTVRVVNLLGQQVAVVADRELAAGTYTFTWDGTDSHGHTVSSGVYFFAIKNAGNMVTRKMMLLK